MTLFLVDIRCGIYYIEDTNKSIQGMIDCAKLAKDNIVDEYMKPYAIYDDDMKNDYVEQMEVLNRFEDGIKNKEFVVYYQPVVDTVTGKMISMEALVRWRTEEGRIIPPNVFIPVLERFGYVTQLDEYVFNTVSEYLQSRYAAGKECVPVSVNLSRNDFFEDTVIHGLSERLRNGAIPKDTIRFEITETSYASIEGRHQEFINNVQNVAARYI